MKLNHINLTSTDVPGDRAMFETDAGLRCSTALGRGLAVMHDDDGMLLVLNDFSKKRGAFTDPADSDVLHIGFLQPHRAAVDTVHARLVADGWDAPAPRIPRGVDVLLQGQGRVFRRGGDGDGAATGEGGIAPN